MFDKELREFTIPVFQNKKQTRQYVQYINEKKIIHITLGTLKERTDTRWTWTRLVSPSVKNWNTNGYKQGTCKTREEAEAKILEGEK